MEKRQSGLRHYTNVGFLKMIIGGDQLKFSDALKSDALTWDDQNDVMTLRLFYQRKMQNPLVLCFTRAITIHHWEYYGNRSNDDFQDTDKVKCCIVFDDTKLKNLIDAHIAHGKNMSFRRVQYYSVNKLKLKATKINEDDLPFIKKYGFTTDKEERLVYYVNDDTGKPYFLEGINACVKNVTLYVKGEDAENIFEEIKGELIGLYPQLRSKIRKSALCNSKTWQKLIETKSR